MARRGEREPLVSGPVPRYPATVSVDQIMAAAASLSREERKALIGRLLALGREENNAQFRRTLAEKIDDQDPSHWVPMEDLAGHLRLDSEME
jgi:hypothetical protein